MDVTQNPSISLVDFLNNGLVPKFDDRRCAFFSCQLLYDALPWADELDESNLVW